jgi:dTDP-4-dehydrorhamnose reductase
MKKKVLVTGANGLLGQKIIYLLKSRKDINLIATGRGKNRLLEVDNYKYLDVDITDSESVSSLIEIESPDSIIHCAAMTNVDACELEKKKCWLINVDAVEFIARAAEKVNAHLLHISTDFVFDGKNGPYSETDHPNPLHYYAESKLASEKIVKEICSKWSIARTIIIYGITDNMSRSNLVLWSKGEIEKGNAINVINDQFRSPTLAEDLAIGCVSIIDRQATGLYHLSGPKNYSIIDLVHQVADFYNLDKSLINAISTASLNQPAKRPLVTGFEIGKAIKDLDFNPVDFKEGISIMDKQIKQKNEI